MAGIEEPNTPTRVQFSEDIPVSKNPSTRKGELTMKYDRNTVQKRIDIENWMDEQLKLLYCTEDDYPMLDLDDVYKFEPDQREERLKEYLKDAKKPPDDFIEELLKKAAAVSKVLGY